MGAQRQYEYWDSPSYENPKIRPTRKVKIVKNNKQQLNLIKKGVFISLLTVSLACFYLFRMSMLTEASYQLTSMKQQLSVLERDNSILHLEIAHLKSPERIQSIASKELGMVLPDKFFFSTK